MAKRNRAGTEQKRRQDSLGLGWANHDHHTYRSSRECFVDLIKAWELLGFHRGERYYAGQEAGWGAQNVEQPVEGIIIFDDVDLNPDEVEVDFSRRPLPSQPKLGTIGLWCGLHGESFLEAGMHHLECRFDFVLLRDQLKEEGVNTMKPFSDFPFLKQAFTQGERWAVRPERITRLRPRGFLTDEQAQKFLHEGAIGSHLENLQRKGGFKGFNQKSVSVIIELTDPRKQDAVHKWASRAGQKLAALLAVRKTLAADARAGATPGRATCAARPTRSIFPRSFHWRRESPSARTTVARRPNRQTPTFR